MSLRGGVCRVVAGGSSSRGESGKQTNHRGGFVRTSICPPERVLRYPDGKVRRIRYPCLTGPSGVVACPRVEAEQELKEMKERGTEERKVGRSGRELVEDAARTVQDETPVVQGGDQGLDLSSPLAFLRYVTSEEYTRHQEEENAVVRGTFEVHASCPWVVPKRVWTLGVRHGGVGEETGQGEGEEGDGGGSSVAKVFYLRTRFPETRVASELNSLLFSGKDGGKRKIRCSSLVDGVVLFTEASDAEEFAERMSVDANETVSVAEHDSHAFFRDLVACRSVAVVIKPGFGDGGKGLLVERYPERLKAVLLEWDEEGGLEE